MRCPRSHPGVTLHVLAVLIVLTLPASRCRAQKESTSLTVLTRIQPKTCYVGQAVDLTIGVPGGGERPRVVLPRIDAEVESLGVDLQPISAGGIGKTQFSQNLYRFHYRLTPRLAGRLIVPSATATVGDRRGTSRALPLTVLPLPAAGRPAEFLGGVGSFQVEAYLEQDSVRVGQSLEFNISVFGPGARGLIRAPDVSRVARIGGGMKIERERDRIDEADDEPEHTFVYRIRPMHAGNVTIPPIAIAGFDPAIERYVTRVTTGLPLRVVDVPHFNAGDLQYGPVPEVEAVSVLSRRVRSLFLALVVGILVGGGLWWFVRSLRTRRARVARVLVDLERALQAGETEANQAQAITEGLTRLLAVALRRPEGALTPEEAGEGIARLTSSTDLGTRAERLMARCDRVLYDTHLAAEPTVFRPTPSTWLWKNSLRAHGEEVLRDIATACRALKNSERQFLLDASDGQELPLVAVHSTETSQTASPERGHLRETSASRTREG